ncbi:hypothetical protein [Glycomyces sp. NPDC048151]|uniref:hypothetical protein n=1 Tax=Glycomyces sp. NPDC048151 TaxID=3364002 RepID=UPI00371CBD87
MTTETPSAAPRSLFALRAVLAIQLAVLVAGALWLYPVLMDLHAMSYDFSTADARAATARYIWLVVPQAAVHLLAAVQIGRTRWGGPLLLVSMAATAVQIAMLMPFVLIAAPFILALILELVISVRPATREAIRAGGSPRRPFLPELAVLPAAAAVTAVLLVWNAQVNDPENRHPEREFNASEAPALLEAAIADPLTALEGVEGFPAADDHLADSIACDDRDSADEEWSEFSLVYWYDEKTATSGPGADAIDTMRDHLQDDGWEITSDQEIFIAEEIPPGHAITAEREDGVRIEFQVADDTTLLAVHSGCVRNAD